VFKNFFSKKNLKYIEAKEIFLLLISDSSDIKKAENKLQKLCKMFPEDCIKYKRAFFSVVKDIDTSFAVKLGEEILKKEEDHSFIKVLASSYKKLGDIKRYTELMQKVSPMRIIRKELESLIQKKKSFTVIDKYIALKVKEFPLYNLEIMKLSFSLLKDIYTKDVMPYADRVLAEGSPPENFKKVVALRYKRLGDRDKYMSLIGRNIEEIFNKEVFSSELLKMTEINSMKEVIAFIEETIFIFPQNKLEILKESFHILKVKNQQVALKYGWEIYKIEKEVCFLKELLEIQVLTDEEEKIYLLSKDLFNMTNNEEYLPYIINYENEEAISLLQENIKNGLEYFLIDSIDKISSQYLFHEEYVKNFLFKTIKK